METTPIQNFIFDNEGGVYDRWQNEAMELVSYQMQAGWKCVEFHASKLGPHTRTFTSEYRYWIWEDEENDWCVYVSNKKGVSFEVSADLSKDQALVAWDNYYQKMIATPLDN